MEGRCRRGEPVHIKKISGFQALCRTRNRRFCSLQGGFAICATETAERKRGKNEKITCLQFVANVSSKNDKMFFGRANRDKTISDFNATFRLGCFRDIVYRFNCKDVGLKEIRHLVEFLFLGTAGASVPGTVASEFDLRSAGSSSATRAPRPEGVHESLRSPC
ncbi:hypothetical protein PoB_001901700 [Plakobranchus ocellatus]|uniref:Uncharacterized protein n=1 Tax=Plakobranchus ocellatus TaxID=259542 RepID=A0AAV3ZDC1_9GAST|nr:hypothetical protein PoB_001901700 [Plakobranchus ocellatus]